MPVFPEFFVFLYKQGTINSPEIQQFIKEHSSLFWYTPEDKKTEISPEFLVETILNYGDMDAVRKLIRLMSIERIADIFFSLEGRKKLNYYPEIYHFFLLFFLRNAHRNI